MTPEEKKTIKAEMEARLRECEQSVGTLKVQTAPVPPSVALGRLTRMDAIQQKSMAEANLKTTEQLIINLKNALTEIDKPNFGLCMSCGQQIPVQRILAVPQTRVCVQCASGKKR